MPDEARSQFSVERQEGSHRQSGFAAPQRGNKTALTIGGGLAVILVIGGVIAGVLYTGGVGAAKYQCNDEQLGFGCKTCTDREMCSECQAGYLVDKQGEGEQSCTFPCTDEQESQNAVKCKNDKVIVACSEGYLAVNGSCNYQCESDQIKAGCLVCEHSTKCVKCNANSHPVRLHSGASTIETCAANCSASRVKEKCLECESTAEDAPCTKCYSDFAVKDGRCVKQCIADGKDDLNKGLPVEDQAPKVRNGYEFESMCVDEEVAHWFILGDWGGGFMKGKWSFGQGAAANNTAHKCHICVEGLRTAGKDCGVDRKEGPQGRLWKWMNCGATGCTQDMHPCPRVEAFNKADGIDLHAQTLVKDAMEARAKTSKPRFVVNVGDSFYYGGVMEETGCSRSLNDDPTISWTSNEYGKIRWKEVFEDFYSIPHPYALDVQVPWFGVLGNHDFGGQHFDSGWDHQIYYTYRDEGKGRWRMPGLYWSQKVDWRTFSIEFFMLDGNWMDAKPLGQDDSHNICGDPEKPKSPCLGPGYEELKQDTCHEWFSELWKEEMSWLAGKLQGSRAEWTALVAHYPNNFDGEVDIAPLIKTYGVDLLLAGHTHYQTMLQSNPHTCPGPKNDAGIEIKPRDCTPENPCEDCPLRIISGGGGGIAAEFVPEDTNAGYGFVDMTMTADELTAQIVNQAGREMPPKYVLQRRPKLTRGEVNTESTQSLEREELFI